MATATQVMVWILNPVTGEWIAYPFVGSRPGFTLVQGPTKDVWFANGACRFRKPE